MAAAQKNFHDPFDNYIRTLPEPNRDIQTKRVTVNQGICLLYTSPSPRDQRGSRMPSSA